MRIFRLFVVAFAVALVGLGALPARAADAVMTAGDLRVLLDSQLTEHVALAASATNAALGGRTDEYNAAAAALDANSVDLSKSIEVVYGKPAGDAFLPLWRKHIGFFVDYTQGKATNDQAKQDKAITDLTQYAQDFGAFLASANPNLTKDAVAGLLGPHVMTLNAVIDAQAAGDQAKAFMALRDAYVHMDMIGSALADAIATQFPDRFTGSVNAPDAVLRTTLNWELQQHTYLAAMATNAALGGRTDEYNAAAAALDANSVDLSKAIASVYGNGAGDAFLPLWRKHIGFFVDYTQGKATNDQAKQDKAVADLTQYAQDFGAFLASANPNLTKDAVAGLLGPHVMTLNAVIDAQAAGDHDTAYLALRDAFGHMTMIANPLTDAIAAQFPEKYGTDSMAVPAVMPNTGAEAPSLYMVLALGALCIAGGISVLRRRSA